ncbi:MAG: DUF4276 family protein [Spirulinaceae cyanobacterium]
MEPLRYTLIIDGPSDDDMLIPILRWLLNQHDVLAEIQRNQIKYFGSLVRKIQDALDAGFLDFIFIHRDAESDTREKRLEEIDAALAQINNPPPVIPIIPIRMTEAWLLFDEPAIRQASGNPNGKAQLNLPAPKKLESLPDPKDELCQLLRKACEFKGRKLDKFKASERKRIIGLAEQIQDFSPLRQLTAFQALETDIKTFSESLASKVDGGD